MEKNILLIIILMKKKQNHLLIMNLLLIFCCLLFLPKIKPSQDHVISNITVFYKAGYQKLITKEYPSFITIKNQNKTVYFSEFDTFNLTEPENEVLLKYEYTVTDCSYMFQKLHNILKIVFSNFYSSKVENACLVFDQ